MTAQRPTVVTPIAWMEAPEWLTLQEACRLSGWDSLTMLEIIDEGGVDLNTEGLIEKEGLYDFQQSLALVLHWDE